MRSTRTEVRRRPLHHRHRAGLRAVYAVGRRALGVERMHRLDEDSRAPGIGPDRTDPQKSFAQSLYTEPQPFW